MYAESCDLTVKYGPWSDLEFPTFSRLKTLDDALDIVLSANKPNSGILVDTLYLHLVELTLTKFFISHQTF